MPKRTDEYGLEPGTHDKPVLEPPEGAKRPDARDVPTSEMPEDFLNPELGMPMDDSPGIVAAVEAQLNPEEEPAEEESEPAEEELEALEEEAEEAEEEAEEEVEAEASEEEDSPKAKGKSRSQRRKEQLEREREARLTAERELEVYKRLKPQIDFIFNDPELAQATRNRMAGRPINEADSSAERFKVPEKPKRPVRPTNFSRERATDDPESPDAKYLDAREIYLDDLEDWKEVKEQIEDDKAAYDRQQAEVQQRREAQQTWWDNTIAGLTTAARKSMPDASSEEVDAAVAQAIKDLGKPESYSPDVLWQFARQRQGRTEAVKKAKKVPEKKPVKKPIPAPASVSPDAAAVRTSKGWVKSDEEWGEGFEQDILNTGI